MFATTFFFFYSYMISLYCTCDQKAEVIAQLLIDCNRLKYPQMRISCDKLVNDSGQLVVDLIMQELTPEVVCKFGGTPVLIVYTRPRVLLHGTHLCL